MRALIFAATALLALPAHAEGPLDPLAFTQGCWRGAFAGAAGVTDERCFSPMLGGRAMRDVHAVRGGPTPYSGETIYAFDVEAGRIAYIYFASDGGGARGFAEATDAGLLFPENRYVGPDGRVMMLRSTWLRESDDRFVIVTDAEVDGQWRELMRIAYVRALDLQPPP